MPEVLFAGEEGRDGVSYGDYLGADDLVLVVQDPLNPAAQLGIEHVRGASLEPVDGDSLSSLGRHGEPGRRGSFWSWTSPISLTLRLWATRPDLAKMVRVSSWKLTVDASFLLKS